MGNIIIHFLVASWHYINLYLVSSAYNSNKITYYYYYPFIHFLVASYKFLLVSSVYNSNKITYYYYYPFIHFLVASWHYRNFY